MYCNFFKPIIDFSLAWVGILLLIPVLIIIAVIVKFDSPGPILFRQLRAGRDGKPFTIFKFRTMLHSKRWHDPGVSDEDSRVTRSGHFLRKWSLDELPQLFNVIKGDMSLVGPRPLLMNYVGRYNKEQKQRLNLKPGITGYQQISCRYETEWEEKFLYDIYYVKNCSFWFDCIVLAKTVKLVIWPPPEACSGVNPNEFKGK